MGLFRKSCSLYSRECRVKDTVSYDPPMPAPNPTRFKIVRIEQVGNAIVVEIHYPDCTNYEGNKVMVFDNVSDYNFQKRKTIDPHFSPKGTGNPFIERSPVARFEPTKRGWQLAVEVAKIVGTNEWNAKYFRLTA